MKKILVSILVWVFVLQSVTPLASGSDSSTKPTWPSPPSNRPEYHGYLPAPPGHIASGKILPLQVPPQTQSQNTLNDDQLRQFLLTPVPPISGVVEFFDEALQNQTLHSRYETVIASDSELSAKAQIGEQFRQNYLENLKKDFDENRKGDVDFMLAPEKTLLDWISNLPKNESSVQQAIMSEDDARKKAWNEAERLFGFSSSYSLGDLEIQKNDNINNQAAYTYFINQFLLLQLLNHANNSLLPISVDAAKAYLSWRLDQARVTNFKAALTRALQQGKENPALEAKIALEKQYALSRKIFLTLPQIIAAEISFVPQSEPDLELWNAQLTLRKSARFKFYVAKKGVLQREKGFADHEMYIPDGQSPVNPAYVIVRLEDGSAFQITEKSFNDLLYSLRKTRLDYGPKGAPEDRYLLESVKRDALFADRKNLISDVLDKDMAAFKARILQRPEENPDGENRLSNISWSMTRMLAKKGEFIMDDSRLTKLFWYGLSLSPHYWVIRDREVRSEAKSYRQILAGEPITPSKTWTPNRSQIKAIQENVNRRMRSFPEKVNAKLKTIGKWLGALAVIGALGAYGPGMIHGDYTSKFNFFGGNNLSYKMFYKPPIGNNSFSSGKKARKTKAFEIVKNDLHELSMPLYYNMATPEDSMFIRSGFPFRDDGLVSTDSGLPAHVVIKDNVPQREGDFKLKSRIPIFSTGEIVPLVSPSDTDLMSIELKDETHKKILVYDKDYEVAINTTTNNIFAHLLTHPTQDSRFSFVASYSLSHTKNHHLPDDKISFTDMQLIDSRLEKMGATELSSALAGLIQNHLHNAPLASTPISVTELGPNVAYTGLYTYDHEAQKINFSESGAYDIEDFKVFLRNGKFFYQCAPSNEMLRAIIKSQVNSRLVADRAYGYLYKDGMISAEAHEHLIVHEYGDDAKPFTYIEIDSTPWHMDPKYIQKEKKSEREKTKEEQRKQDLFETMSSLRFFKPTSPNFELKPVFSELAGEGENPVLPSENDRDTLTKDGAQKNQKFTDAEKKQVIDQITIQKEAVFKVLNGLKGSSSALADITQWSTRPGARTLALSNVMIQLVQSEITVGEGLNKLIGLKLGLPSRNLTRAQLKEIDKEKQNLIAQGKTEWSAIIQILKYNIEEIRAQTQSAQTFQQERKTYFASYLLNHSLQERLTLLNRTLTQTPWDRFDFKPDSFSTAAHFQRFEQTCEGLLER